MNVALQHHFSGPITVFQDRRLPERATPAGYAALIDACSLHVPLPRTMFATGERHRLLEQGGWRLLTPAMPCASGFSMNGSQDSV